MMWLPVPYQCVNLWPVDEVVSGGRLKSYRVECEMMRV